MKNSTGFTLIELMIVVAIMSILMTVGLPSFQSIINDSRLTSTSNAMLSAYQLARSEAIKQHKNVYVTTADSWATWQVTVKDATAPFATFEASKKIVIAQTGFDFGGYKANGRPITSTGSDLSGCDESTPCKITLTADTGSRSLEVVMSGRTKVTNP